MHEEHNTFVNAIVKKQGEYLEVQMQIFCPIILKIVVKTYLYTWESSSLTKYCS